MISEDVWTTDEVDRAAHHLPDPALAWRSDRSEWRIPVIARDPVPAQWGLEPPSAIGPTVRMMTFRIGRYRRGNQDVFRWSVVGVVITEALPDNDRQNS